MTPVRMVKSFLTVGGWTMMSRVLGLARDILVAASLGTGPAAQAFVVAFSLPNLFRRFFAEGAFNTAFIPIFAKKLESGEQPLDFAREAASALATLLIALTLIAMAAMPWLVLAMASGFYGDERFDLSVEYGRIAFPYILFVSLAALCSGVSNALGRFTAAAAAPALLNTLFIVALVLAPKFGWSPGLALAWAVPIAGFAQLALVWYACKRVGFGITPKWPRLSPDMKRLARVAAPAMLAAGVVQVNLLVGRQVASWYDNAIAWLFTADRLYQLPLGVVAIAIGVVLLPDLSRRLRAEDEAGAQASLNRATEFALALTLPAAVALVVLSLPIISVLFERGEFTATDSRETAMALAVYGIGLPAFVLQKVLQPLYFAREDTRRPFYYALVAMVVNLVVAVVGSLLFGYIAAAWATTVAGWVMVWQLWHGSRAMGQAAHLDARLLTRAPRILIAALVMGAALWGAQLALSEALVTSGIRYIALTGLVVFGVALYFGSGLLLGAFSLIDFKSALKRGPKPAADQN